MKKTPDDSELTDVPGKVLTYELKAPYSASDSLNPFFCTTYVNDSLMRIVHRGLVKLNRDLSPRMDVAHSYNENEQFIRIVLKDAGNFVDGSPITPEDIVYSFNKAKSSALYSGALSSIVSAQVGSPMEVLFYVNNKLGNAVTLLTFPIVKTGTAESADDIPVGCANFKFDQGEDVNAIVPVSRDFGQIAKINLIPVSDSEKLTYTLQTSDIDFFTSDLYGERLSRSAERTYSVPQNNLVFMGLNSDSYLLSFDNIKNAVWCAVNRNEIADSVYSGNALAAVIPMRSDNISFKFTELENISAAVDSDKAVEYLISEGFTTVAPGSGMRSGDKGTLNLTLLVNSESGYRTETASCIKDSLSAAGIGVTIKELAFDEYTQALESGSYDMYLGEIKIPANGSLSAFFGGSASFGISSESPIFLEYQELEQGTASLSAFMNEFINSKPFMPLVFRNDVLVCNEKITVNERSVIFGSSYANITEWAVSDKNADEKTTGEESGLTEL